MKHTHFQETLKNARPAWICNQKVALDDGQISDYWVDMKMTFMIGDSSGE
ncbi:dodecin domain-containing protein [Chloroflexota bacterium]